MNLNRCILMVALPTTLLQFPLTVHGHGVKQFCEKWDIDLGRRYSSKEIEVADFVNNKLFAVCFKGKQGLYPATIRVNYEVIIGGSSTNKGFNLEYQQCKTFEATKVKISYTKLLAPKQITQVSGTWCIPYSQ